MKKNKTYWPIYILIVVLFAIIAGPTLITYRNTHKKPVPPSYYECVKCHHLFAPGTGKDVVIHGVASDGMVATNSYCSSCKPAYDVVRDFGPWRNPEYLVVLSGFKQVNEDGSEINPHRCPTCTKIYLEDILKDVDSAWFTLALTNWLRVIDCSTNITYFK